MSHTNPSTSCPGAGSTLRNRKQEHLEVTTGRPTWSVWEQGCAHTGPWGLDLRSPGIPHGLQAGPWLFVKEYWQRASMPASMAGTDRQVSEATSETMG